MAEKNHSKRYWDVVASILPDYEKRKLWLRNNGMQMKL
ncbi:YgjP-like metallopeptidase domain-containing protein [Natronincola ferrireducens]